MSKGENKQTIFCYSFIPIPKHTVMALFLEKTGSSWMAPHLGKWLPDTSWGSDKSQKFYKYQIKIFFLKSGFLFPLEAYQKPEPWCAVLVTQCI